MGQWLLYKHTPSMGAPASVQAEQIAGMADAFRLSAVLGLALGLYCFLLPHTPPQKGKSDFAYVNGTLHGNPIAAAAGLATIQVLEEPGFYDRLHEKSQHLTTALQEVLDRHALPAIAAGKRSLWQILFMTGEPRNQTDIMASDVTRMRALDLELLRRGIYVLPGVRRFVCAVNTDEDFDETVGALDAACRAIN